MLISRKALTFVSCAVLCACSAMEGPATSTGSVEHQAILVKMNRL